LVDPVSQEQPINEEALKASMDADKPPPENAEMFRDMKSKGESS